MAIIWLIIAVFNLFRNRILVINTHSLMVKNAIGFNAFKFKLKDTPTVGVPNKKTGLPSLHIIAFPHYNKPDDFYRYIL